MSTLRVFLAENALLPAPNTVVEWRLFDANRGAHGRDALSALPRASRIELFIPASCILLSRVTLPPGGRRQARKLLTHALDNQLLGDGEDQHLAWSADGDTYQVAVIERALLDAIVEAGRQAGVTFHAIYSVADLLPDAYDTLSWFGHGWASRQGCDSVWLDAANPAEPPAFIPTLSALTLRLDGRLDLDTRYWQDRLQRPVERVDCDPLTQPLRPDAVNLLQGEFARGAELDLDWSRLRPTALLAGVAALLWLGSWFGGWMAMRNEAQALRHDMNSAFSTAFPGTPIVDAKLQLAAKLKERKPDQPSTIDDNFAKLERLAPRLPGAGGAKLLGFELDGDTLVVHYQTKPENLPALTQALSAGARVENSRSNPPDRVQLTLKPL
ncbi:type II secretion system protein GspL [Chitinimonas lacunae]|uniref:Type II secretion system protein GspL n=1 Tax=Chitinimonas lacunae TaxID=1963018 RepID=A0ABV8MQK0_9NEIS